MITLTLRTRSGRKTETRNIEIPCLWEELTFSQLIRLLEAKALTDITLLSILSGLSENFLKSAPASSISVATDYLFFLRETPNFKTWARPSHLTFDGKLYEVPKVKEKTFGQKVYLQNKVNSLIATQSSPHTAMPYAIAVYFYPIVTGDKEYDDDKIVAFIPKVMSLPAMQAAPVADFFLSNCISSYKPKQKTYILNQLKKNLRQALQISSPSG